MYILRGLVCVNQELTIISNGPTAVRLIIQIGNIVIIVIIMTDASGPGEMANGKLLVAC